MAENYSLHMPARKAAAAAQWGPVLCEEDRGIWADLLVYNARVESEESVCVYAFFPYLSQFELKILYICSPAS